MANYSVTYLPYHQNNKPWARRRDKTIIVRAGNVFGAEEIVRERLRKGRRFHVPASQILSIVPCGGNNERPGAD